MPDDLKERLFLLDITTNVLLLIDKSGKVVYSNARAAHIFNRSITEAMPFSLLLETADDSLLLRKIDMAIASGKMFWLMITYNFRQYMVYIYPVSDDRAAVCLNDITENLQLSEQLQKSMQRLEFAEKTTRLGYWEVDLETKKTYWSAEMYRIFGIDSGRKHNKDLVISRYIYPADLAIYKSKLRELVRFKKPVEGTLRLRGKNDEIIYGFFKASILTEWGRDKIAGTLQDLTALFQIQIALDHARKQAEEANLAKSYFLAQASHDLRQPMQALKIFIEAMEDEKMSGRQKELLKKIAASADNLYSLLDNLLDISKIDSGGLEYQPICFNIDNLLQNLSSEFKEIASDKGIDFRYIPCHKSVCSDPLLVERIIRNLISNAVKYTKNRIIIGCHPHKELLHIMVIDNGEGIPAAEKSKIFNEFYQSPQSTDKKKSGAGLGLSIVKKIAALIGSDIQVASEPGKGSCFSFDIPIVK